MRTHWMNCANCGRSVHTRKITKYCGPECSKQGRAKLAKLSAKAPELVEALRKLVAWESNPDKASSDAADIAAEARSLLAEIDGRQS